MAIMTVGFVTSASAVDYKVVDGWYASNQTFDADWTMTNVTYKTTADGTDVVGADCIGTSPDCNFASPTFNLSTTTIDAVRVTTKTDGTLEVRAISNVDGSYDDMKTRSITSDTTKVYDNLSTVDADTISYKLVKQDTGGTDVDGFVSMELLEEETTDTTDSTDTTDTTDDTTDSTSPFSVFNAILPWIIVIAIIGVFMEEL